MLFGQNIWDFYASWYDKLWVQKYVLKPSRDLILQTLKELPSVSNILDMGCGIGELCADIKKAYPEAKITGIDPSGKMIERAVKDLSDTDIMFQCGFVRDLSDLQQYDIVVSTNAFPYVMDKKETLVKIHKLLNPNGRLLLLFANKNNWYDALWLMIVKLSTSKAQYLSVPATCKMLENSGFKTGKTEKIKGSFFLPSIYMIEGIAIKDK
jgi:trans-aconitate methyltransferase